MLPSTAERISRILSQEFGLSLEISRPPAPGGSSFFIRPASTDRNESIEIEIELDWRSVGVRAKPEKFAGGLVRDMGSADADSKRMLQSVAGAIEEAGGIVKLMVNGSEIPLGRKLQWPTDWNSFEFSIRSPFIDNDTDLSASDNAVDIAVEWGGKLLGMLIPILPLENTASEESAAHDPEIEGSRFEVILSKPERSRRNRAACLAIHGTDCAICGFSFSRSYGPIGDGFIHVHHLEPLGNGRAERSVDPEKDLIPLCPNCHAMVHQRTPPHTPEDVKGMMEVEELEEA